MQLALLSCQRHPSPLLVATAASNQFTIEALLADFARQTGIEADLVVAASGQLTAQIMAGAPYHVFISADDRYPGRLASEQLLVDQPLVFAHSSLVLWSVNDASSLSLDDLAKGDRLAIANPRIAPFGRLADSLLRLRPDYAENIAPRLVYGESIGQVNQFIMNGAVTLGITARSVVNEQSVGHWRAYEPGATIPQTVAIMRGQRVKEARAFQDFLLADETRNILIGYGYLPMRYQVRRSR